MPDNKKNEKSVQGEVVEDKTPVDHSTKTTEATFQQLAMSIRQQPYKPTQKQVDKMLALQEKSMDYTHNERTRWQPEQIRGLIIFGALIIFAGSVIYLIVMKVPQFTSQVISALVGLLGGMGVGYGYGTSRKNKNINE